MEKKDFFISYNRADEEKAVWINWKLKSNGFTTVIQVEDFGPGNNFVLAMQKAATEATRTIAVLSPDYLQSKFTAPEWAAAFVQDPLGEQRIFIPVRVRSVELTGLIKHPAASSEVLKALFGLLVFNQPSPQGARN